MTRVLPGSCCNGISQHRVISGRISLGKLRRAYEGCLSPWKTSVTVLRIRENHDLRVVNWWKAIVKRRLGYKILFGKAMQSRG
jgi:hypothetical protein